jgi:hypothetical protein
MNFFFAALNAKIEHHGFVSHWVGQWEVANIATGVSSEVEPRHRGKPNDLDPGELLTWRI